HDTPFDWNTAPTSKSLEYAPCYIDKGDFQCARLEMPMDYWNGTTNATISLAVIRKPAKVPITDSRYGGAVLTNPGGPGGSGVNLVVRSGQQIQDTIDSEDGKYLDLISFDPRGVAASTPTMSCFSDDHMGQAWSMRQMEEGVLKSSDAALGRLWAMASAYGGSCSLPLPEGEADIKEYMSTSSVATDMLSLIEAHGGWREREAKRLFAGGCPRRAAQTDAPHDLKYRPGKEKIQYWGFSYGSYLGMTYAAMYPDRIDRLIVDGVVDAYDYRKVLWYDNLFDTEADMNQLFYHCARVGYPACALANKYGKTAPADVKQRIHDITESLYHNPLPVIGPYPDVTTYSDIYDFIFRALYSPITGFPQVADILADIEVSNGTRFAKLLKPQHDFSCPVPSEPRTAPNYGAQMAIACSDGDDQSYVTRSDFEKYWKSLVDLSPTIGDIWAMIRLSCIHYSKRAKTRFVHDWKGNTSYPILFLGNEADPVTPVRNCHKMAKGFEGARVLTQKSAGHCTFTAYSRCTERVVRAYFSRGDMPGVNATCGVDEVPF
ncbi:hypothetical protein DOTSEDRAFT_94840, partial [Dothistroma septosporum NZE10]